MNRLTNKILLMISCIIMAVITVMLVYFRTFAEVTPSPVSVTKLTQELKVDRFTGVTNGRGFWRINFEQADTQSVAVYCGDNLFDNYLDAHVNNGVLVLDLDDKFEYANTALMDVTIKSPEITDISPQNTAAYWLKKISLDSLYINASGSSLIIIDTCDINNLKITAGDSTSIKSIESNIGNVNYNIFNDNITEFSNQPGRISGSLTDNSFIKIKDRSVLTPKIESESKKIFIEAFPGLPAIENANKLKEYMKELFAVSDYETGLTGYKREYPYLNYFFSHIGRTTIARPVQSFSGGKFLDQKVYYWHFYYVRGVISQISIFYPEGSNLEALSQKITAIYGMPDKEGKEKYHTASWKDLNNGINSSGTIWINQGVDSSLILGFNILPLEDSRIDLEKKWTYYNYSWIWGSISKDIIEREFLGMNKYIANKQLGQLLLFFY